MTLSKCCAAPISYDANPMCTGRNICVKCGHICVETEPCSEYKPMKHTVKVGDRFKLGPWEWEVLSIKEMSDSFTTKRLGVEPYKMEGNTMYWNSEDAEKLDWIKPEMTFMECDTCRAKPGSPQLCNGCLNNRQVIEKLTK